MSIEQTGATTDIETTVSSMWAALSARDWDGVKRQLAPHCIYLDMPVGDVELRLGRQHIVWGEMVGLFFADVVSARDMREFFTQEFDQQRIPQWAARAEYFKNDWRVRVGQFKKWNR